MVILIIIAVVVVFFVIWGGDPAKYNVDAEVAQARRRWPRKPNNN